ncbi:MAG: PASTA domain-containing protein [Ruminococcus sp.]|nr:PASTA domain-containing protein [Ruminococcus sp.]
MDKKLKKAAEKITMSDQLRDRILDQCNNASTKEKDGAIEVSGVERVEHKPISRIVAAAAACAVLAGGVGMTAHLLNRNGAPADEIEESSETETADTDSLFDFTGKEYSITDVERDTELESSDQITAFLNCMDWGEQKDPDIYAGYYTSFQQTTHIEVRDRDKDYFYYINIAHTIATPPAEGETGIVMVTAKETDDKDWADGYYAIDLDTLTVFLGDEELRQDFGMKNLWPDFAGTNFSINGWGTSVDADKMELANIGEAIDALEFTPLGEVPEEYGQDSGEAWHLSSDQNELVLFPSGVAIYHKNVINQDSSLTNIYNTYYTYDYEAVSEILAPFIETNDQRDTLMPDLVGMEHELAEDQLRQLGVNFETAYISTDKTKPGYIVETKPAPGNTIAPGDKVMIYISMSDVSGTVENYLGMKEEDAATMANYSGLKVIVEYAPGYSPQGTVIGQSLPANEPVDTGSEITLTVSTGEPSTLENFPPFGNLYKMGCFINGSEFASGNETSCIVSDILSRYDWSSEETVTERYKDAEVLYIIDTIVNEAHRIVYFYSDGTVEWLETQDLAANNIQVHRYNDIDGENNDLVFQLRQVLDELMPYNQLTE